MYVPAIRAAREWGQRPTAVIFQDQYFGYRDPFNGNPLQEPEWSTWDYVLISALQLIEDYSTEYGLPIWEVDENADNVDVVAVKRIDKFEASKERITSRKNYKPTPGERFVPKAILNWGEWPTFEDWVEYQSERDGG